MKKDFEYLKKQIIKELETYNISVSRHGRDRVSRTLHIQLHVDEGIALLEDDELEYTEEELRNAFYKGREQKSLPNSQPQFIRPTFQGYLRELDGMEDPEKNWEKRLVEYYEEVDPLAFNRLRILLVDHNGLDENEVIDEARLKDDLGLDSLDIVEFTMEIEREFNIMIEDDTTNEMMDWTFEQVVNLVLSKIEK